MHNMAFLLFFRNELFLNISRLFNDKCKGVQSQFFFPFFFLQKKEQLTSLKSLISNLLVKLPHKSLTYESQFFYDIL